MRRPRAVPAALPAVLLLLATGPGLAGCGGDDAPLDTSPRGSTSPSSSSPASTPTPPSPSTPAPSTPAPSSPAPTEPPASTPGEPEPPAAPDVCAVVTAQQVRDVLFVPVELTRTAQGCRFAVPGDASAPAVEYRQGTGATAADVATAESEAAATTGGQAQPVDDTGDEAFFAVGAGGPGGQVTGAGGVRVGTAFVRVTVTQAQDLIEPEVAQYTIDAVGLAGDALR